MPRKALFKGSVHSVVILRLILVFILLVTSRLLLYFFNINAFGGDIHFSRVLVNGFRFDISALMMLNAPYILLAVIPFRFRINLAYKVIPTSLFYIANILALALNTIDAVYYPFNLKRLTWDIFSFLNTGDGYWSLIPQLMIDFWYAILVFGILVYVLIIVAKKFVSSPAFTFRTSSAFVAWNTLLLILWAAIIVIGVRGGFQLKPITIIDAGRNFQADKTAAILNTPFTLAKTYGKTGVSSREYMSEKDAINYFSPIKNPDTLAFRPLNVVIIIMESFSNEHIGRLNKQISQDYKGFTPFFDSLMNEGVFYRSFANGKRSIEGIPAIVASLPSWMNGDFITSVYASTHFNSLAHHLKSQNYKTSFFHGGKNGTMNFDAFCKTAGFGEYVGMNEYGNDKDFDGNWGIYDEEFFKFWNKKLSSQKPPFFSVCFSLSSHHPYSIPEKYTSVFPEGKLKIQQSIAYADYSLQQFFKEASKQSWYSNTLFIITADHSSEANFEYYKSAIGQYSIPLLFFTPGEKPFRSHSGQIAQQIDIMPTVLSLLHYKHPYVSFGNNLSDSISSSYSLSYLNGIYQYLTTDECIQFDGDKLIATYQLPSDSLLKNPALYAKPDNENKMKAIIQQFNQRLKQNRMTVEHE